MSSGPYSGKTLDYTGLPPLTIGSLCQDGLGGNGTIVTTATTPILRAFSTLCTFTVGRRAGTTVDYAQKPPIPLGTRCRDEGESSGFVIAKEGPYPSMQSLGALAP